MSDISSTGSSSLLSSISQQISDLSNDLRNAEQSSEQEAKDVFVFQKNTSDVINDSVLLSRDIGVLIKNNSRLNVITSFQAEEQADHFSFRVTRSGELKLNSVSQLDFDIDAPENAPTDITLSGGTVYRYAEDDTVVATLSAEDPDKGDSFTYAIVNEKGDPVADSNFKIVDDQIQLKAGNTLSTDQDSIHKLRVRAKDTGGNTYVEDVHVRVSNSRNFTTIDEAIPKEPVNFRIQLFTQSRKLIADNEGDTDELRKAFAELTEGTFEADAGNYVVKVSRAEQDDGQEEIQYALSLSQGDYKNDFDTVEQPYAPDAQPASFLEVSGATTELLDSLNEGLAFFGNLPPLGQSGTDKLLGAMTDLFV